MSSPYAAVAVVAALVLLAGCTDDEPSPEPRADPTVAVDDAQRTYAPLVDDVVAALEDDAGPPTGDPRPEVVYYDGELESCAYASSRFSFEPVFGEEVSWDVVREATEQALAGHGFELTDQLDIPGGNNGFDAVADDGARFEVRSKLGSPSTIDLVAPLEGSCDTDADETLPPLGG